MVYIAGGGTELYHHGILGQKWGIRRYQNADGSYTAAGRSRYSSASKTSDSESSEKKPMSAATKKKIVYGAAATLATVAAGVYLYNNPEKIVNGASFVSNKLFSLKNETPLKVANVFSKSTVNKGKAYLKTKKNEILKEAGKAAVATGGKMVLNKLNNTYNKTIENNQNLNNIEKGASRIVYDTATKNLRKKANSSKYANKYAVAKKKIDSNNSNTKTIDKSSPEYQNLFKIPKVANNPEVRSTIKSMASQGYSIEQIKKYIES